MNGMLASDCRSGGSSVLVAVPVRAASCGLVQPRLMPF